MDSIFTLAGEIVLNDSDYEKSLKKSEKDTEKAGDKMNKSFKKAAKGGAILGGAILGAGAAALAGANKFADTTDRIDKMSHKIGLSREGFQEWDFILSQSGGSIEGLQMGMKTLNTAMTQAIEGAGKGAENFEALGISQKELAELNQEDTFELVVTRLQEMEEGAYKTQLANELLGRSGQELAPLLNGAAGSIDEMKKSAQDLGLVIGGEAIDAGVVFTDQTDQIQRTMGAAGTQILSELMPAFSSMADWLLANMPAIQQTFSTVFNAISTVVSTVVDIFTTYLLPILETLYGFVEENFPAMQELVVDVFDSIFTVVESVYSIFSDSLLPILQSLWDFIEPTFPLIGSVIATAFDVVIAVVQTTIDIFAGLLSVINKVIDAIEDFVKSRADADFSFNDNMSKVTASKNTKTGKANGGRVYSGQAYNVGERGVETFVPDQDGTIIANSSGGITVNINNAKAFNTRDIDAMGSQIVNALRRKGVNPNG